MKNKKREREREREKYYVHNTFITNAKQAAMDGKKKNFNGGFKL